MLGLASAAAADEDGLDRHLRSFKSNQGVEGRLWCEAGE